MIQEVSLTQHPSSAPNLNLFKMVLFLPLFAFSEPTTFIFCGYKLYIFTAYYHRFFMISGSNPEPNLRFPPTSSPNFSKKKNEKLANLNREWGKKSTIYHGFFWGGMFHSSLIPSFLRAHPRNMVVLTPDAFHSAASEAICWLRTIGFAASLVVQTASWRRFVLPREKGGSWGWFFTGFLLGGTSQGTFRQFIENHRETLKNTVFI